MKKNSEQPAFPHDVIVETKKGTAQYPESGLTKREYFAGLAMQGLLANSTKAYKDQWKGSWENILVVDSLELADSLIKKLEEYPFT